MSRQNQNSGLQTNRNREESRRLDTDTKLALVQSIRMQSQFNRNQCQEMKEEVNFLHRKTAFVCREGSVWETRQRKQAQKEDFFPASGFVFYLR